MPVFLSHSLTAALSGGTASEQEAVLLDLARRRPRVSFYDVLREREQTIPVLVAGGRVERIEHDLPPHLGTRITSEHRDEAGLELLVDYGDVILPGWGASAGFELDGEKRVVTDLDELIALVDEDLADEQADTDLTFLRALREATRTAQTERLPIVVHW